MKKTYIKPAIKAIPPYDGDICQIIISSQGLEGGSEAKPGDFGNDTWGNVWEDSSSKTANNNELEW